MARDLPVTKDAEEELPKSNSKEDKTQTKQLETKISNPYFNEKLDRENVSKMEQKVNSEIVVEESEPKIGVFGFKNEKYVWPSG